MPSKWSKKEISIWGLGMCGGATSPVDAETVGVYLWKVHPGVFGLRKYPAHPDVEVARCALSHCGVAVERKKGKGQFLWMLSSSGRAWFDENRKKIEGYVRSISAIGERRSPTSLVSAGRIYMVVVSRIRSLEGFKQFSANLEANPRRRKHLLSVEDFFCVFNIDEHTPATLYEEARRRVLAAISNLPSSAHERKYVTVIAEEFGDRYQSAIDEMVETGG
jgi:hypothetical protein